MTTHITPSDGTLVTLMCLIIVSGWIPTIAFGAGSNREKTEASSPNEVTGTLSALDLASGRGMIRTDLGKPIYLEVRKLDLFRSLSVGDRVTIQLNEDGQVDKMMGASVSELGVMGQPIPETINK